MTSGRELIAVPDEEIATVRALGSEQDKLSAGAIPAVARVRIHGGFLEGVEGVLTEQTGRAK